MADVYNVFNKQTGYSIQPVTTNPQFGNAAAVLRSAAAAAGRAVPVLGPRSRPRFNTAKYR